jgi:hypothetical protein
MVVGGGAVIAGARTVVGGMVGDEAVSCSQLGGFAAMTA